MTRALAWIGAVALVMSVSAAAGYQLATTHAQAAQWRAAQVTSALRDSLRAAERAVRVDSVTVDRVVTRWRVVRDSLVDTLRLTDTVHVLVRAADDAVTACTDALGRCQQAIATAARTAAADSVTVGRMRVQLLDMTQRASRAESRAWRYRAEGAAVTGGLWWTLSHMRP